MDTAAAAQAFKEHGLSPSDTQALGETLAQHLRRELAPALGEIHWFRADWQRGGAATGFATWTRPDGQRIEAMVKVPVGYREWFWTTKLGTLDHAGWGSRDALNLPTPRLLASGVEVGGHDLAWIVVEKLAGPPMSRKRSRESFEAILATTAEFQGRCGQVKAIDETPPAHDWHAAVKKSREAVRRGDCPDEQHWGEALKKVSRHLDSLTTRWNARPLSVWCHGDLHPANALRRDLGSIAPGQVGRCVLIDLALVHAGHWAEDALYLERQHWGHEEFLHGVSPVEELARRRQDLGLEVESGWQRWADLRRVLTAASAPGLIGTEGNARYLAGSLVTLNRSLKAVV